MVFTLTDIGTFAMCECKLLLEFFVLSVGEKFAICQRMYQLQVLNETDAVPDFEETPSAGLNPEKSCADPRDVETASPSSPPKNSVNLFDEVMSEVGELGTDLPDEELYVNWDEQRGTWTRFALPENPSEMMNEMNEMNEISMWGSTGEKRCWTSRQKTSFTGQHWRPAGDERYWTSKPRSSCGPPVDLLWTSCGHPVDNSTIDSDSDLDSMLNGANNADDLHWG